MEPARPTWSSTPHPPAETSAASPPLQVFSPGHAAYGSGREAGLTSKSHRDRRPPAKTVLCDQDDRGEGSPRVKPSDRVLRGPLRLRLASACRCARGRSEEPV